MRKPALIVASICVLTTALTFTAGADDNKTVNAMVTPKVIAITANATSLDYGSRTLGSGDNVPDPTNVLIKNTGTVVEDFKIKGAASSPGGWTLTGSIPGAETYRHKFDINSGGGFAGNLTTSNQSLWDDVAANGEIQAFFRLDMPASTISLTQQTLPITITALESLASGPN